MWRHDAGGLPHRGGNSDVQCGYAERDLPQETSQMRALHFNKGCYLGQEIVERSVRAGSASASTVTGAGWARYRERGLNS